MYDELFRDILSQVQSLKLLKEVQIQFMKIVFFLLIFLLVEKLFKK